MILAIAIVVSLAVGFGLGRIKNAKKLAYIKALVESAEGKLSSSAASVVAAIRAKL